MSVASLAGYLANVGGSGGGDTFENIYIGEFGTQVELSCAIENKLNITGITTKGVDIYNDAGNARVKLTCLVDGALDINNLVTYTVQLTNEKKPDENVLLNCEVENTLSVGNIKISDTGITFADSSVQITAYTGGGDGNVFETVTIGASDTQVELSCDTENVLLINGENAATQPYVNESLQDYLTSADAGTTYQTKNDMSVYSTTDQANALYQPINTGSGGAVDSVNAGTGISVDNTTGAVTVTNDGVLALTAGTGIAITGSKNNYTITNSFAPLIQKLTVLPLGNLAAVNTVLIFSDDTVNPFTIPSAGTYLFQWSLEITSYTAAGAGTKGIGEGYIRFDYYIGTTFKTELVKQYFCMVNSPTQTYNISGCCIITPTEAGYIYGSASCQSLLGTATQFGVEQPFGVGATPAYILTKF